MRKCSALLPLWFFMIIDYSVKNLGPQTQVSDVKIDIMTRLSLLIFIILIILSIEMNVNGKWRTCQNSFIGVLREQLHLVLRINFSTFLISVQLVLKTVMDFHFLIIENNTTMSQKKDLYVETKNKLRKGKKIHISCEETL